MPRDMTIAQFRRALAKNGIVSNSFMGYCDVGDGVCVSYLNAPTDQWRDRLAYLLKEQAKHFQRVTAQAR